MTVHLFLLALAPREALMRAILQRIEGANPKLGPCVRAQIAGALLDAAGRHEVPPLLLCALVARESGFDPNAFSPGGAVGLGQIKRETAKALGVDDPWDIRKNLLATAEYLRWMLDEFEGQKRWVEMALAAYHLGPKAVKGEETLEKPEIKEYVGSILAEWLELRRRAGLPPPEGSPPAHPR